jgi:hypothetical protein
VNLELSKKEIEEIVEQSNPKMRVAMALFAVGMSKAIDALETVEDSERLSRFLNCFSSKAVKRFTSTIAALPVAQWIRASGFYPVCREFKSLRGGQW